MHYYIKNPFRFEMASSLQEICLKSIQEALESGPFPIIYRQELKIRKLFLESLLTRWDVPNSPTCIEKVTSIEFLDGFTTLDLQRGITLENSEGKYLPYTISDHELLDRLVASLSTVLPNEKTLVMDIVELKLNVYHHWHSVGMGCGVRYAEFAKLGSVDFEMSNFGKVGTFKAYKSNQTTSLTATAGYQTSIKITLSFTKTKVCFRRWKSLAQPRRLSFSHRLYFGRRDSGA